MRNAFVEGLLAEASFNPDLIVLTGDLGFGVFEEFEARFPKQFLNLGITEQAMASFATGLGLKGRPVVMYSIGNFPTLRCLEQIRNGACYHGTNLTIVATGGGFSYGQLGMSHHATEDLAVMRSLPNMEVFSPCSSLEVEALMPILLKTTSPCYLRLDKTDPDESPFSFDNFAPRRLRELMVGTSGVVLIVTGGITKDAIEAANQLESEHGLSVTLYSCHCIKPFDSTTLLDLVSRHDVLITIEEHNKIGGLGSVVAEELFESGCRIKKFQKIAIRDCYASEVGDQSYLKTINGLDALSIRKAVLNIIEK